MQFVLHPYNALQTTASNYLTLPIYSYSPQKSLQIIFNSLHHSCCRGYKFACNGKSGSYWGFWGWASG